MARSAALNPASMPFFPGAIRSSEEEGSSGPGIGQHIPREQDRMSSSSLSISPTDFRSVRSSPSPPHDDRSGSEHSVRFQSSSPPGDGSRPSPTFRQVEASRSFPGIEGRPREASMFGSLDTLPEGDDTPGLIPAGIPGHGLDAGETLFTSMISQEREPLSTPPVAMFTNGNPRSSSFGTKRPFTSSSPVSSLDSIIDQPLSFEAQLKASTFIHDILDRLVRCEHSTREIQRDLGDVHRKVNLLVERSLGAATVNSQPEFKDPFAPSNTNGQNVMSPSILNGPRGSISGGIAPNQIPASDDITQISQRLNTLTSSVGQLLALQTQQHIQTTTSGLPVNQSIGQQSEIAPNQIVSPGLPPNQTVLGHGLPNRPDLRPSPRAPNPPMRTWSVGALDLPVRPQDGSGPLGRQEALLRDKRRSITSSALMRRDSAGVCWH